MAMKGNHIMETRIAGKSREGWLDAIKGFAIICIILGHTIERMQTGTGYINAPLHFVDVFVNRMHIYVFFMVSGFLYAKLDRKKLQAQTGYVKIFIKKKFLDFMLPYLFFAGLIWVGKMCFAAYVVRKVSFSDLFLILVRPVAFMWFIYVLFAISIIVLLLDKISRFNNSALLASAFVFIILYLIFEPSEMALKKILHNMLLFVLGVLVFDNIDILQNQKLWIMSGLGTVVFGYLCYAYEDECLPFDIIESIASAFFFFRLFYSVKDINWTVLEKCGKESLFLYIIHPVVLNLVRMIFIKLHIENITVWLVSLFIAGVGIPYIYAYLASKYAFLEIWFRPRKYIEGFSRRRARI